MVMKKICIVTTLSSSIDNWIKPFLPLYRDAGIDVSIACHMTPEYQKEFIAEFPYVRAFSVPIPRGIDFFGSLRAVSALLRLFRREKFEWVSKLPPDWALGLQKLPLVRFNARAWVFSTNAPGAELAGGPRASPTQNRNR